MTIEEVARGFLESFGFLIAALVVSELLLLVLNRVVRPLVSKTRTTLDDRLIEAVQTPVRLLGVIVGVYLTVNVTSPGAVLLERNAGFWLGTALIAWGGLLAANLVNAFILWYYREVSAEAKLKARFKISEEFIPFVRRAVKITIYALTFIVLLDRFGVEVGPLLAALGIGGLAVALAVKDSLANFFAGIYLLTDKPIRQGEYIAIDNEQSVIKGFVEEVGWRTTRVRTRGNFTYYIPNEKITNSNLVNFSRGIEDNWKGSSILVGVDYSADAEKVKKLLVEAVKKVRKTDKRISSAVDPVARLEDFGDNALVFRVMFRITNHFETEAVQGAVREQVIADLRKARISIPFPQRTVHLKHEAE